MINSKKFSLGQVVITPGAEAALKGHATSPFLNRHSEGDWGDVDDEDKKANDAALEAGDERLFSAYLVDGKLTLWIITEADRSVTTILLPDEH